MGPRPTEPEALHENLRCGHGQVWPHGARCTHQDQKRNGHHFVVPTILPRGDLRVLRDEHQRFEHLGLFMVRTIKFHHLTFSLFYFLLRI